GASQSTRSQRPSARGRASEGARGSLLGALGRLVHNTWQRVRSRTVQFLCPVSAQPLAPPVIWLTAFHCRVAAVLDEAPRHGLPVAGVADVGQLVCETVVRVLPECYWR